MQKQRIMQHNRAFAMKDEPHEIISWLEGQSKVLEKQVAAALDKFRKGQPINDWLETVHGIGPVLAAGLIAHIDIKQCPTVGHIWSFAGLDPNAKWEKGEKRPWNANLKTLCWKIGDSFKKFHTSDKCLYGHVYQKRKVYEEVRNERGDHEELCEEILRTRKNLTPNQKTYYEKGNLPPGRIDLRAMRYATKQFLADMHHVWYKIEHNAPPPKPYPIQILGHVHQRKVGEVE